MVNLLLTHMILYKILRGFGSGRLGQAMSFHIYDDQ